ncbi:MAG: tryptophan-rich sensory protein [Flavobacteriales bacterium]|nr:tryptophan-rich sensory protein [Flavobacteriales bacterium]MCW8912750.1 tryptophan-rich sensory protein [Flavobacteriales bacterium]MCW8936861.1 tryptophan-rich sensory protein [Flavobacteriales bacterium]MCW8940803.1 tryptophan-rich sensory protein [Flavobacteriales bacterium]MCW8968082.1 tryptophan-rich sensory protein [Flavobacteriales bacterium]
MFLKIIIFLVINFAALGIGSYFTSTAVTADWYQNLNKAPWTPPGWFFGFAWTTIMICFAVFMAYVWQLNENRNLLIVLFVIQWILNVSWNPVFFKYHQVAFGLFIIVLLTVLMGYFFFAYLPQLKVKTLLVLPYFIWLLVATSLNAYILVRN